MFPYKNVISRDLIPAAIILGSLNPYYNKLNIKFGAYAQVYIGTTNITKKRTVGAIALILFNVPSLRETSPRFHMSMIKSYRGQTNCPLRSIVHKLLRGVQFLCGAQLSQSQKKMTIPKMKTMRQRQHIKTRNMMTSLKMQKGVNHRRRYI